MSKRLKTLGFTEKQIDKMVEITDGEIYKTSKIKFFKFWFIYILPSILLLFSFKTGNQGLLNLGVGLMALNIFVFFFAGMKRILSMNKQKDDMELTKEGLLLTINPSKEDKKTSPIRTMVLVIFGISPIIYLVYLGYLGTLFILTVLVVLVFGLFAVLSHSFFKEVQKALDKRLAEDAGRTTKIVN